MAIPIAKSLGAIVYTNGSADNEERVLSLGADRFIDYKKEDYADILSDVDCVLDTLGKRELAKELSVLKKGGSIVSLRAMPNGEFAKRSEMCAVKQFVFKMAGSKFDKMAAKRGQTYYFIFVHEDGEGLRKVSEMFIKKQIHASVDGVFTLDDVNKALQKVASGGSKGKTIIQL